ncbi:nuclear factor NF-kappa-B p105 subunit-like protein [Brachionus plicatilis]|uniref:Nuclear factor NF-kappa-B p105 subunit-like protein n=1 Tax=Brachionus plicatilis TaxID=10195 RepID=A0A3M7SCZ8_BRAPC|nr:nuclear factor NF-kappa-B p105 subunit-like protein [Brachionus plicatilis]
MGTGKIFNANPIFLFILNSQTRTLYVIRVKVLNKMQIIEDPCIYIPNLDVLPKNARLYLMISIVNTEKQFLHLPNPNLLKCNDRSIRLINYEMRKKILSNSQEFLIPVNLESIVCEIKNFNIVKCSQNEFTEMVEKASYDLLDTENSCLQDDSKKVTLCEEKIKMVEEILLQQTDKCRIKIELISYDKIKHIFERLLDPIYTNIIYDSFPQCSLKKFQFENKIDSTITNQDNLRILRVSQNHGSAEGNEEIFIFLSYFDPNDLKVEFFELDKNGNVVWQSNAKFDTCDSHVNFSLVIHTPKLFRPSTGYHKKFHSLKSLFTRCIDKEFDTPIVSSILKRDNFFDEESEKIIKHKIPTFGIDYQLSQDILIDKIYILTDKIGNSLLKFSKNRSVHDLLKVHQHLFSATDANGNTPIHLKIFVDVIRTLPDQDIINMRNSMGLTPLLIAAHLGELELSEFLLEANAEISISDYDGNNPIHIACKIKNLKLLEIFLRFVNRNRSFGVLNGTNHEGYAPIHLSVLNSSLAMLREFLYFDQLKINSTDKKFGFTALHYAARDPFGTIILDMLMKNQRIDVNVKSYVGYTPLHLAVLNKNYLSTINLLKNGADPNLENDFPLNLDYDYLNLSFFKMMNKKEEFFKEKRFMMNELFESSNDESKYVKISREIEHWFNEDTIDKNHRKYFLTFNKNVWNYCSDDLWMKEILGGVDKISRETIDKILCFEKMKFRSKISCSKNILSNQSSFSKNSREKKQKDTTNKIPNPNNNSREA